MVRVAPELGWQKSLAWAERSHTSSLDSLAGISLASIEKRVDPGPLMHIRVSVLS